MSEVVEKSLVLDSKQINQKITRIAFEIYENNFKEKTLVFAGIDGQGYNLAQLLAQEVEQISEIKTAVVKVILDKQSTQLGDVSIDVSEKELKKKVIILVDDVLNTGRTLAYGLKPFLQLEIKKLEVAVLVNRSHSLFPVLPTYTGYDLATTLNDHVQVTLGKKASVYLL
jgi:pyrimidine operon attenuation protein / uracil phosphoribosyltransferase